jgi:KaiC/GvpD/RAD55 family RecA-like ATPase
MGAYGEANGSKSATQFYLLISRQQITKITAQRPNTKIPDGIVGPPSQNYLGESPRPPLLQGDPKAGITNCRHPNSPRFQKQGIWPRGSQWWVSSSELWPTRAARWVLSLRNESRGGSSTLQTVAHAVIELQRLDQPYGVSRLQLRVIKVRGSKFHDGPHDYVIQRGGLVVFWPPRKRAPARGDGPGLTLHAMLRMSRSGVQGLFGEKRILQWIVSTKRGIVGVYLS